MVRVEKTVFVSYRRSDVYTALAVYQDLTNKGYDVFFDYTSISSGDFEQIIIGNIKARAHFLLVLSPTALDRCNEPGDWLRREIEIAIDEKRNIIPLFFKGFSFGTPSVSEKLTGKLRNISHYNGLNVHEDYFQEAMQRLHGQFLNTPLDTVLHPVSTEVQKVVKEEKIAADKALKQREDTNDLPEPLEEKTGKPKKSSDKKSTEIISPRELPSKGINKSGVINVQDSSKVEVKPKLNESADKYTPNGHVIYTFGGIEFVKVVAGKFLMGSSDKDKSADADENPQHWVDLPYEYYMGRFPVTNEQYAEYVKANGAKHLVSIWEKKRDHPVVHISWNEAMGYCKWLTDSLKGRLQAGLIARLPTEAEWEKAARGEKGLIYPWGDTFDKNKCNTKSEGHKGRTTPVGAYSPQGDSLHGCVDMSGNVWEWTHSLYKPYPYQVDDGREDFNSAGSRVLRGGSYYYDEGSARCAYRYNYSINFLDTISFFYGRGFRVVVSIDLS